MKALPRTVKAADPQLPKMRRKRRKAYRKWKLLNPTICEPQPANQACQKNVKGLEKVKGDTSEAVSHQTRTLGKSKGNGDERTSASMNGKQNSSFLPKDKKQPSSDSKRSREKGNDDSSPSISHQLKEVLPAIMFNDCEGSLSGKITLQDFPNTVEGSKQENGKIITEVKYGDFNVQVANKSRFFSKTEIQFPTKKRCPKCHQCYSVRHIPRCYSSRSCSYKYRNISIEEIKSEAPSKYEGETARTESSSLEVSIVGKGIKVKYMSKKQNIIVNITHPKRRGKTAKYGNVSSDHTTKEPPRSSAQPGARLPGKGRLGNKHRSPDPLHTSPPALSAVQEEVNPDTAVVSLCSPPERKNKPDRLFSVSDGKLESAISQQKDSKINWNTSQKKQFFEAEALLRNVFPTSHDALKTTSLSNADLRKMPFEDRKVNFDIPENTTADSYRQQSTGGRNYLPSTITNISPVQRGQDSDFYSSSSLNWKHTGAKAASIYGKGSKIPPADDGENSKCKSFPPSQNTVKPSIPSHPPAGASGHSEPKETLGHAFPFGLGAECVADYAEEHADGTGRDFTTATLHSDSHTNMQQLLETKSTQCPSLSRASSGGLAAGSPLNSSSHSSVAWSPTGSQESQAEIMFNDCKGSLSGNTEVSAVTSITDELEQRLIIQNDKESTVDTNCPMGIKHLKDSPSFGGNVEKDELLIRPVVKTTCHREFEDLSNGEACFQMKFPLNTAEFNSAVCAADNLFLIEKPLTSDADQYSKQDEITLGLTSFTQEAAECQSIASMRPNAEGDKKETYHHQMDILHSPQKQKALKDWNLQINSLLKLPQELPPRGTRASDGSQKEAIDQWARRRQQFKDGKSSSSAGRSSFASTITEGSIISEDSCSVDFGFRVDIEEKGFYTEIFHSAAWVFRGDDGNPEDSPRCLSKKPRPAAVRERTLRLFKGTDDCPWGFQIQFSKPIVVTEVDANGAAEEAGLQVGDMVLAVNGTEVTSAEHAEAVHLARKGPDILTLVVGSDISRCPNTPRPTCRGYLHKRTHSGFVKGWRKRWFVLKHDGCLHYHRHKKDEGKCPPLEVIKLEGAEVDIDSSLGKPFVFNCVPQSGNRTFCLCATSNQEMKRWLEAMHKAAHPVRQNHVWEDVTLHNSSLPPLAIKNPECLGLLHQLDRSTDMWAQRYCILKDGCLYLYASIRSTQASGGLYLQGYRVNEQTLSFKQSIIELKPPSEEFKTFYFCAENKTENQRWITALKMSIKKWLPLHQAIQDFINRPLEETRM
ncbi:uncharacterized protein LOC132233378 [Myotis daubentonii]|uniref:uncharacterized protein LOC132233378 n=1 Tax=Myotis daubentonii TaxID=98922 RepID=UPI002872B032|nr:uncharacterized protein LOC132233378 [Myotis daubentonii]